MRTRRSELPTPDNSMLSSTHSSTKTKTPPKAKTNAKTANNDTCTVVGKGRRNEGRSRTHKTRSCSCEHEEEGNIGNKATEVSNENEEEEGPERGDKIIVIVPPESDSDTPFFCILCQKEFDAKLDSLQPVGNQPLTTANGEAGLSSSLGKTFSQRREIPIRFVKFLSRYAQLNLASGNVGLAGSRVSENDGMDKKVPCCDSCHANLDSFCRLYCQFENIKMQLDQKVCKIRDIVREHDPQEDAALQRSVLEGKDGMREEERKIVDAFREEFMKKGKPLPLFPKVVIQRLTNPKPKATERPEETNAAAAVGNVTGPKSPTGCPQSAENHIESNRQILEDSDTSSVRKYKKRKADPGIDANSNGVRRSSRCQYRRVYTSKAYKYEAVVKALKQDNSPRRQSRSPKRALKTSGRGTYIRKKKQKLSEIPAANQGPEMIDLSLDEIELRNSKASSNCMDSATQTKPSALKARRMLIASQNQTKNVSSSMTSTTSYADPGPPLPRQEMALQPYQPGEIHTQTPVFVQRPMENVNGHDAHSPLIELTPSPPQFQERQDEFSSENLGHQDEQVINGFAGHMNDFQPSMHMHQQYHQPFGHNHNHPPPQQPDEFMHANSYSFTAPPPVTVASSTFAYSHDVSYTMGSSYNFENNYMEGSANNIDTGENFIPMYTQYPPPPMAPMQPVFIQHSQPEVFMCSNSHIFDLNNHQNLIFVSGSDVNMNSSYSNTRRRAPAANSGLEPLITEAEDGIGDDQVEHSNEGTSNGTVPQRGSEFGVIISEILDDDASTSSSIDGDSDGISVILQSNVTNVSANHELEHNDFANVARSETVRTSYLCI